MRNKNSGRTPGQRVQNCEARRIDQVQSCVSHEMDGPQIGSDGRNQRAALTDLAARPTWGILEGHSLKTDEFTPFVDVADIDVIEFIPWISRLWQHVAVHSRSMFEGLDTPASGKINAWVRRGIHERSVLRRNRISDSRASISPSISCRSLGGKYS